MRRFQIPVLGLALLLFTACGAAVATKQINIVPTTAKSAIEAAKCAAQQDGWTLTLADATTLSGSKTVGMDNVPLSLNVTVDGSGKARVSVNSPRGASLASSYQRKYLKALEGCGATAQVVE